jgi:hypothetical protein
MELCVRYCAKEASAGVLTIAVIGDLVNQSFDL